MIGRDEIIQFYKKLYPAGPYNVRLMTVDGEVAIHDLTYNVEEIVENHELLIDENLHWYISVNKHKKQFSRIMKTGEIDKIVLDFDSENPDDTIRDARIVDTHFRKMGYDTVVITSGRKGIHIHVKVNHMENVDKGIKTYFDKLAEKHDLKTLDTKVYADQSARITRIPGTMHPRGGPVKVIDIYSADTLEDYDQIDITKISFDNPKNKILEMMIQSYQEEYDQEQEKYKTKGPVYMGKMSNQEGQIKNWNVMDKVFPMLYETGKRTYGTKHIVTCPFHDDKSPSAFYDDKMFHCSACDISVGTFNFLVNYVGKSKHEAIEIIKNFQ